METPVKNSRTISDRRKFLKLAGVGAAGAVMAAEMVRSSSKVAGSRLAEETGVGQAPIENELARMQEDLR
ncbi:MAG TPA: twin-arginine translocation signal domain-containing protein, partial [Blastocatellia bacterium]|nr:twin-arginine translocation signal domain-containing protein [Blastocatellia bacterium]